MGAEIERKFLLDQAKWEAFTKPKGKVIKQFYLLNEIEKNVRVRVKGDKGFLTIKGKTEGISRAEFEYEIPVSEAEAMFTQFAKKGIDKIRYEIDHAGHIWEVDEFHGDNEGLILAEIELQSESESFEKPDWITEEVSLDPRYYNAQLISNPYKAWSGSE